MKRSLSTSAKLLGALLVGLLLGCAADKRISAAEPSVLGLNPLNATYILEGREISLQDGRSETVITTDSATKVKTSVWGAVVSADLDDDGDDDAVLSLVHEPGGSGTFYYLVVALNEEGQYRGTNALPLGDRISVQEITARAGIIETKLKVRGPDEPMSSSPSVVELRRSRIKGGKLVAMNPLEKDEQILQGWVSLGHEVRTFTPCPQNIDFWLSGASPALHEISTRYRQLLHEAGSYPPLFMTLAGHALAAEKDGFGADYAAAFLATQLLAVRPQGNCWSDSIVVTSPRPGQTISSPVIVTGRARGSWFFEGDFPLVLKDVNGGVISESYATAQGAWMTKEFVSFVGTLQFATPPAVARGVLVIKKDNPTGQRGADREILLRIFLK